MEQVCKATTELQKTTKGSYQHFSKEKENMRKHFEKMKVELAEKTVEIVNMVGLFSYSSHKMISYIIVYEENE